MKKICLTVVGMYFLYFHGFSQDAARDSSGYKPKKLTLNEVNIVSSYYDQTANKSSVMGGRNDYKGVADVTDLANGLEIKFVGWDAKMRKNTLTAGLGLDAHTAASQAYVDSNGTAKNNGTRIYPTIDWTRENERKGTSFGFGAYYSAEHNYYHSIGLNASASKKTKNNGEFSLKLTGYFDQIKMIYPAEFVHVDSIKNSSSADSIVYVTSASGQTNALHYQNGQLTGGESKTQTPSKSRDTYTASFAFSQVINARLNAAVMLDLVYMSGYLGLPFHRVYYNNGKDTIESLPSQRFKLPLGLRVNYFLGDNIILRGYYRFYADSWGLTSQTASLEIPFKITPFFSLTPFYRFYTQTAARYFAAFEVHTINEQYFSSNYALASFTSQFFGLGTRIATPKGILIKNLSSLEIRYGHYTQSIDLNANIISLSLSFK